jgi:hypothetical protein
MRVDPVLLVRKVWLREPPSSCEALVFKSPLKGSPGGGGGATSPPVGEPVSQLLMDIALGKVELFELVSEAL